MDARDPFRTSLLEKTNITTRSKSLFLLSSFQMALVIMFCRSCASQASDEVAHERSTTIRVLIYNQIMASGTERYFLSVTPLLISKKAPI